MANNLWGNAVVNSGGGIGYPPSFNRGGMIFAGIGNAGPYPGTQRFPNSTSRSSDNVYAQPKIIPEFDTLVYANNVKPFDLFDLDNHLTPVLVDTEDGQKPIVSSGKRRRVFSQHGLTCVRRMLSGRRWRRFRLCRCVRHELRPNRALNRC